jgi:hypothetical protein
MDNRAVSETEAYQAIVKILDHLEYDEEKHWESCSVKERRNHIYNSVRLMRKYLEQRIAAQSPSVSHQ